VTTTATFDLLGDHAITRNFSWRFSFRRLQPGKHPQNRQPVDLTGLTARLEIFDTQKARNTPHVFSTEHPLGEDGEVAFVLSGAETRSIPITAARYRVVFSDPSGEQSVLLRGRLAVLEEKL